MGLRFASGEFYHIYNRGVEKREIFNATGDYERFLAGLIVFNGDSNIQIRDVFKRGKNNSITEIVSQGESLVSIVSYVLMKNHIHLLLKCKNGTGMSDFLRKLLIGYTMYFNTKYKHSGVLFQGRTKAKHVNKDIYLNHLVDYIHLNPLDYSFPEWRKGNIGNIPEIKNEIKKYPWSSMGGILREKEDPILDIDVINELFPEPKNILSSMLDWSSSNFELAKELIIEN